MKALGLMKRVALAASLISLVGSGCGGDDDGGSKTPVDGGLDGGTMDGSVPGDGGGNPNDGGKGDASTPSAALTAPALRTTLNLMLSEHLVLAAKATGAAFGGNDRKAEFDAYGAALNNNGLEVGKLIGTAYGSAAETQFNAIWSAHNGWFVDYTKAVIANNATAAEAAVNNLTTMYVPQFVTLLATATGLPSQTLTELTVAHVTGTKAIVDAQKNNDWPTAYEAIRDAFSHMSMIGSPLADATAKKLPTAIPGDAMSKASTLRTQLNQALQEHFFLASFATNAALHGRAGEAGAAITALNDNGTELGAAIAALFGAQAGTSFNTIWSAHNGFFVEYTTAVAQKDADKQAEAVNKLTTMYVPQFTTLLVTATGLPEATVTTLVTNHVLTTKAVVDAQAADPANWTATVNADLAGAHHMRELGDPLAAAIVAKLPSAF